MDNLLTVFQENIKSLGVSKKTPVLLAVSGGLDSVVLTALCTLSDLNFSIAHANFQLRGAESERDEKFVENLAINLNRPLYIRKFDTTDYAAQNHLSIQVAARNLRYEWFSTLLAGQPENFQFLITAHHLDDSIETMLMQFFRGTGIAGLRGIPVKNEKVIRPLISIQKSVLKDFAMKNKLTWVEDSSNASVDYTRNYFRNELIPSLETIFPDLQVSLEKNLERFSEAGLIYLEAIGRYKKKLLKPVGDEVHIPILLLKKTRPLRTICFELIREYHFSSAQTDELIRLMDSSNGKFISSSSHRIIKNRGWLIIAPLANENVGHFVIERFMEKSDYGKGRLTMSITVNQENRIPAKDETSAALDGDRIHFPLILRKWKTGDYFYPLGMNKKKKLARFFIDQKLSKTAKENIWVLVMDSHIIWIVGHRIDNRFRVTPTTKRILTIKNEGA
jgi:tRNA(Ile)-lysidine synthase